MPSKPIGKLNGRNAAKLAAALANEKLANDIIMLDLRKVSDFTDYFVICSGSVDVHVKAIANYIENELKPRGHRPIHIEGEENAKWVLIDYGDFIVHIFLSSYREYYALERLWGDAVNINLTFNKER